MVASQQRPRADEGHLPSEDIEEGNIVRVMRKGYQIGDRLLRPSNVVVAISADAAETPSSDE